MSYSWTIWQLLRESQIERELSVDVAAKIKPPKPPKPPKRDGLGLREISARRLWRLRIGTAKRVKWLTS